MVSVTSVLPIVLTVCSGADTGQLRAIAARPNAKGFAGPGSKSESASLVGLGRLQKVGFCSTSLAVAAALHPQTALPEGGPKTDARGVDSRFGCAS